jgi:type I restriction enzyme, S subunit
VNGPSDIPEGWDIRTLDDVSVKIQDGTHFSPTLGGSAYRYITSRNIGYGRLRLDSVEMISESEHRKIYRHCDTRTGDLLLTKDGANTGNAAINSFTEEISLLSSVAFIRANHRRAIEAYILQYLLSTPGRKQIEDAMAGNAITRLTLAKIKALRVPMPPVDEQRRIAAALGDADDLIAVLERMVAKQRAIKMGMMQQLLTGRIRLDGFRTEWQPRRLGDLLAYEQPGPYLVSSTDYTDTGTPVLTAGKTFLLGHTTEQHGIFRNLPVIIFDDFTTASKFVDFPFKAKSSAMKMLSARPGVNLRYVFERMQLIDFVAVDHKRRWIAEFSKIELLVPEKGEQDRISAVLEDAASQIAVLEQRLEKARAIKIGMMQQLLNGRRRLAVVESAA